MISVLLLPAFVVALLNRLGCVDIWWDLKALSWCPAPSISLCLGTSPIHLLASQPRGVTPGLLTIIVFSYGSQLLDGFASQLALGFAIQAFIRC